MQTVKTLKTTKTMLKSSLKTREVTSNKPDLQIGMKMMKTMVPLKTMKTVKTMKTMKTLSRMMKTMKTSFKTLGVASRKPRLQIGMKLMKTISIMGMTHLLTNLMGGGGFERIFFLLTLNKIDVNILLAIRFRCKLLTSN